MIQESKYFFYLSLVLYVMWFLSIRYKCPCNLKETSNNTSNNTNNNTNNNTSSKATQDNKREVCYRFEIQGIQVNHVFAFILLGYFLPSYFLSFLILGTLWELFEYYIDKNQWLLTYIGGCLDDKPHSSKWPEWQKPFLVYKDSNKKGNIIDNVFNLHYPKNHWWHYSIAIILVNCLSFTLGKYLRNYVNSLLIVSITIILYLLNIYYV